MALAAPTARSPRRQARLRRPHWSRVSQPSLRTAQRCLVARLHTQTTHTQTYQQTDELAGGPTHDVCLTHTKKCPLHTPRILIWPCSPTSDFAGFVNKAIFFIPSSPSTPPTLIDQVFLVTKNGSREAVSFVFEIVRGNFSQVRSKSWGKKCLCLRAWLSGGIGGSS